MIFHKSMLAGACEIARVEKDAVILLEPSGEVVAINQWAIYVAQPTSEKVAKSLPLGDDAPLSSTVAVSVDQVFTLIKSVGVDKQFKGILEHISINQDGEQRIECKAVSSRTDSYHKIRLSKIPAPLKDWRKRYSELGAVKPSLMNFVFNRKRLSAIIAAIEASCKYDGEFAYISQVPFTNGYIWKSFNELTGQTILIAHVLPVAKESDRTEWELRILNLKIKKIRLFQKNILY